MLEMIILMHGFFFFFSYLIANAVLFFYNAYVSLFLSNHKVSLLIHTKKTPVQMI